MNNSMSMPLSAIIAITFRCNARCTMCDIWKGKIKKEKELPFGFYSKLPKSLKDINLTGGEPFLRSDFVEIIFEIKKKLPFARLIVNTNGFVLPQINKMIPKILKIDPNFAVRVSLDGYGKVHDEMRGVPGGFKKATSTLKYLKNAGVNDLGVVFTLTTKNQQDLLKVFNFTQEKGLDFSLNLVHESPIYFGKSKLDLLPNSNKIRKDIEYISKSLRHSFKVKNWGRAWFNQRLIDFYLDKKRSISCCAGNDFFYLNPYGKVYACHLKNSYLGNLKDFGFQEIWNSFKRIEWSRKASRCNDCWMICTVKDRMKKYKLRIAKDSLLDFTRSLL